MKPVVKISTIQFRMLVMLYTIGSTIVIAPAAMTVDSKQTAWIPAILGVACGFVLVKVYIALGLLFKDKNLVEINDVVFGKYLGKGVSCLFVLSTVITCSRIVYYVGSFLNTHIMMETPLLAIHIIFMLVVVFGARLGLETIARCCEIFFPWFVGLLGIFIFSLTPQMKLENLMPLMDIHLKPLTHSVLIFLSITYFTFAPLMMIFPLHLRKPEKGAKALMSGSLLGGFIMVIVIFSCIIVIGSYHSSTTMFPVYEMAKRIEVGNFLQGIEVIIAIIWFLTLFFKVSLYFHASIAGLCHIFNINETRFLTLPMGLIVTTFSIIVYPTITYQKTWLAETWILYSFLMGALYPFILLIIGWIRFKPAKIKIKKIIKST